MMAEGNILKMRAEPGNPVQYNLPVGTADIFMNKYIGSPVKIEFTGRINCIACGRQTKTSFGQGFCYSCLQTSPEASESVLRPELSKAHFGIARDMEWAKRHDLIDHFVYLAASSHLKVGVTRNHQVPVRWIDQGASSAIILAKTPNRHIAGVIEVWLKKYYTDKTNWRDMLQNRLAEVNLPEEKIKAIDWLPRELQKYAVDGSDVFSFQYPVVKFPGKLTSLSLDKSPRINEILTGIKGQYLLFENGMVLNIRKHSGYFVRIES